MNEELFRIPEEDDEDLMKDKGKDDKGKPYTQPFLIREGGYELDEEIKKQEEA
jgi:hypothetical protein